VVSNNNNNNNNTNNSNKQGTSPTTTTTTTPTTNNIEFKIKQVAAHGPSVGLQSMEDRDQITTNKKLWSWTAPTIAMGGVMRCSHLTPFRGLPKQKPETSMTCKG
jgi:hypothetical protein